MYIFRSPIICILHTDYISNHNKRWLPTLTKSQSFLSLLMVWHCNKRQYTADKTHWENLCICERAERASLESFCIFTLKNYCYFFQYFVGTAETLSVLLTYLSAYMYRHISKCTDKTPKKHYWGQLPPPPPSIPPLATLPQIFLIHNLPLTYDWYLCENGALIFTLINKQCLLLPLKSGGWLYTPMSPSLKFWGHVSTPPLPPLATPFFNLINHQNLRQH